MIEGIKGEAQAAPDRRGACGRELLAADDVRQACKARLALAQVRHSRELENRFEPLVSLEERADGVLEVSLGLQMNGHEARIAARRRVYLIGSTRLSCAPMTFMRR